MRMYVSMWCTYMHECVYVHMFTLYTYACMYECMYTCMPVCMHPLIHPDVCIIYMHVSVYCVSVPNPELAPVTMATFPLKFTLRTISEALVCD